MAQTPNGFSVPMVTLPVLTELELIDPATLGAYLDKYPDLSRDGYIMPSESLPGVLKWVPNHTGVKYWQKQNKPLPSFQIVADVTGAAGATVVATLTAGSHLAGGSLSPVAIGQTWVDDSTNIAYEVVDIDKTTAGAHEVSLSPRKASVVPALTAADSFLKYYGRDSVNEASHIDDGIYKRPVQVTQDLSIIRANKSYSDLTMFERIDYGDGLTFYQLDRDELDKEFTDVQELRLMFGQSYDNTKYENNKDTDALGLIPQIIADGQTYNAPTAGVIDQAYFDGQARKVAADGLTNEYHILSDVEFDIAFQNYMNTFGNNGGIIYASFGGSQEVAISRNFGSFSINGITYHRKHYAYFESARTHGADQGTGYWTGTGLFIPQGEVTNRGDRQRYFNIFYQSENEGGQIVRKVMDGAMFNPNGSTSMHGEMSLVAYKGIGAYNLQSFTLSRLG